MKDGVEALFIQPPSKGHGAFAAKTTRSPPPTNLAGLFRLGAQVALVIVMESIETVFRTFTLPCCRHSFVAFLAALDHWL